MSESRVQTIGDLQFLMWHNVHHIYNLWIGLGFSKVESVCEKWKPGGKECNLFTATANCDSVHCINIHRRKSKSVVNVPSTHAFLNIWMGKVYTVCVCTVSSYCSLVCSMVYRFPIGWHWQQQQRENHRNHWWQFANSTCDQRERARESPRGHVTVPEVPASMTS